VFFRVSHLLHIGVIPVIVVEGIPPDLKQGTMKRRQGGGRGGRGNRGKREDRGTGVLPRGKKVTRTRFNAVHKEVRNIFKHKFGIFLLSINKLFPNLVYIFLSFNHMTLITVKMRI